jgi:hypothetical protein
VVSVTPYDGEMKNASELTTALSHHGPLGRWYAEPIDADAARQQLARCGERRQRRLRSGRGDAVTLRLACAVARFQLGENIDAEMSAMEGLFRQRHSPRALALLFLIHGQLLAARQLPEAKEKLAQGFRLANHLLHPQDYFNLLHRHNLLARLPVTSRTSAQSLKTLLQTAAVQERLELTQKPRRTPRSSALF